MVGFTRGTYNERKMVVCNAILAVFRKSIEGKCVDGRDGHVEVHARDPSRFVEGEQARATKCPRLIFPVGLCRCTGHKKWAAHAVNNRFKVGSDAGNASGTLGANTCEKNIATGTVTEVLWVVLLGIKKALGKWGGDYSTTTTTTTGGKREKKGTTL